MSTEPSVDVPSANTAIGEAKSIHQGAGLL